MTILELLRDSFILGIDIVQPGVYAYAVTINNYVVEKGEADEQTLLKIIKKYRPLVIAIDNLRELLDLGKKFLKALGKLPFTVHIVQVTRVEPDLEVSVEELARKYLGLTVTKLSPVQTAEVLTILVTKGVGSLVKLYEPETRIIIKARLGTKEGGMSRLRYERNIRHRIKQLVEEISKKLDQSGLDYDLFFNDAEGVRSATFVVYADKSIVRRLVKPVNSMDVKVVIEQVLTDTVKFLSLSGEEKYETKLGERYLIVGVDPGIVTGLAILDLNGRVLLLHSAKNLSRRKLLDIVYDYGTPIVIATDVAKVPDYVRKLCSMIKAVLYSPERDLTVYEKSEIVSKVCAEQKIQVKDPHQRDALAAAYKAYLYYKPKLDKVVEEVKKLTVPVPIDEIKAQVIRGLSIKQAIDNVLTRLRRSREYKVIVVREQDDSAIRRAQELESRVRLLETELRKLENEKKELELKLQELQDRTYIEVRKDMLIRSLESRIKQLEGIVQEQQQKINMLNEELERVKKIIENMLLEDSYIPVFHLDLVTCKKIMTDVVYCERIPDITLLRQLVRDVGLKMVIVEQEVDNNIRSKIWDKASVIIVGLNELGDKVYRISSRLLLVDKAHIDNVRQQLMTKLNREVTESLLEKIVKEYRNRRMQGIVP